METNNEVKSYTKKEIRGIKIGWLLFGIMVGVISGAIITNR